MKLNAKLFTLLTIIALIATGCGTKKGAGTTTPSSPTLTTTPQQRVNTIAAAQGAWTTMQCGGKISIDFGGKHFSSSMQMRMQRGKAIYISLRPALGIEVARIVIVGDSIFAYEKLHKRYIAEKVSLITAGVPVTIDAVQDIFLGRSFIIGEGTITAAMAKELTISENGQAITLQPTKQYEGFTYNFNYGSDNKIRSLSVMPQGQAQTAYTAAYSDVTAETPGNIAHATTISGDYKGQTVNLDIDLSDVTWNRNVEIDTSLPRNYKRVDARRLLKDL